MAYDVATEEITCAGAMPAFLARPAPAGRYPVVILIHERYGLVPHTRDLAKRCAGDGYFVVAANFFYKHPDQKALNAGDSRYAMTDAESIEHIKAAIAEAEKHPGADINKIAVAGYCQTGRHPLVFAAQAKITAAVVWYGAASKREWPVSETNSKPMEEILAAVDCPVFAAFGGADHIISIDDVRRFRNTLEEHKKTYDIHVYADAPHGWLNDTMPGRYRAPQADAGWADQQLFLKKVFASGSKPETVSWHFDGGFARDYDFAKTKRLE
ncbi:MAG: carboxymethylenebutenolidase [Alphaproteobacteria bacterium]|jgi:carboxymethylenebutenolidase|nr:carboxymethylenebutenolidase [Alphaproteobacteria bacterium]